LVDYFGTGGSYRLNKGPPGKAPFSNPLANALVVVLGSLFIVAMLVLGFFAFLAIAGLFLVLGIVLAVRTWWRNRGFLRDWDVPPSNAQQEDSTTNVIEGEFRDVSASTDRDAASGSD